MFYDNFDEGQICGLYSVEHVNVILAFVVFLLAALHFSKRLKKEAVKKVLLVVAVVVTILEITKITIRICKGEGGDGWIPLYFCHIFLYSIWLSLSKNEKVQNLGMSFMVFGGIFGGIANTMYPSTSLMLYPLFHPGCLYSVLYHFLMVYCGILVLMKGVYKPKASHFFGYFALVTVVSAVAVVVNHFCGTNMMFLANPFGLDVLLAIYNFSSVLYMILAYLAQAVLLFWAGFGIWKLIEWVKKKKLKEKNYGSV